MIIDYKLLADNDPGGDLMTAFESMQGETITTRPEVMITYRKIGAAVGLQESAELEAAVNTPGNGIPKWVDAALSTDGIDVNNQQVSAILTMLVTSETAAAILAMGEVVTAKYPGLKPGHLQNAREMRAEGEI